MFEQDLIHGLPAEEVLSRAREARKVLGGASRALLFWLAEVEERGLHREWGYSSVFVFAECELELDAHTVSELLRTSRSLKSLPHLFEASAEIAPSKLREISRVATEQTEDFWLETARKRTCRDIEKLVAVTPKGGLPGPSLQAEGRASVAPAGPGEAAGTEEGKAAPPEPASPASGESLLPLAGAASSPCGTASSAPTSPPAPELPVGTPGVKLRHKFVAEMEADDYGVLEEALRVASRECGSRDRATVLRYLAESFLSGSRGKAETKGTPPPPFRLVIHEAPAYGIAWMEGPTGARFVPPAKVEEARCCGEILDLRKLPDGPSGPTWDGAEADSVGEAAPPRPRGPLLEAPIPPSMRRFVYERDGGVCSVPGCHHVAWEHCHHVRERTEPGSSNDPTNLALVCSACHTLLHERRLSVEGCAPDRLVWRNAKGQVLRGSATSVPAPEGRTIRAGAKGASARVPARHPRAREEALSTLP